MIALLRIIYLISFISIVVLVILIIIQKYQLKRIRQTEPEVRQYIFKRLESSVTSRFPFSRKRLFHSIQEITDQMKLSSSDRVRLYHDLLDSKDIAKLHRLSHSIFPMRRLFAFYHLSFLENQREWLIRCIGKEKNVLVLFYQFYFSLPSMDEEFFDLIMKKVIGLKENILSRISIVIANHYDIFYPYLSRYNSLKYFEHIQIQLQVATKVNAYHLDEVYVQKLYQMVFEVGIDTLHLKSMFLNYLDSVNHPLLLSQMVLDSSEFNIRKYGYRAISKQKKWSSVVRLFNFLSSNEIENQYIIDLVSELALQSTILNRLFFYQTQLTNDIKRRALAKVLADHINDLILKLNTSDKTMAIENLHLIIEFDYIEGIIDFVNHNHDEDIESQLFELIPFHTYHAREIHCDFFYYIYPEILYRHDLTPYPLEDEPRKSSSFELSKFIWLAVALILGLLTYPLISILHQGSLWYQGGMKEVIKNFALDTNYFLIYYFVLSNAIYILLMILSVRGGRKQDSLWEMKSLELLYEDGLLPAISIIAPAYNEEVNIITSVRSLLNLKYPKYEVIVVNDGSKDTTLERLIDFYQLKRRSSSVPDLIQSKAVRGIYYNPEFPNLYVVNKVNGGKADALNVGINVSHYGYICGIDADSVLEQDALLKLMSTALDHKHKVVALGGNIVPANGCKIDQGYIEERHFPKRLIPRFQSVEYLRSFSSGRIGWSSLKSLLIISGAFGLFNKKDIIRIGGYISSAGALNKDSVGEDMELVVRLTYERMKKKKKSYIGYVYHANCYTELPSDTRTLLKQRNRWHRGLIDILSYHRRMMLNPRFKHIGLFVIPYFYLFEVLGPFFEWIGYLALFISLVYGFLAPTVVALIFGLSIVLGVIISLLSLMIQERQKEYLPKKDMIVLILFSIIENFGYRQLLSLHRIYSFFTAFFESGKWGEQKRKGI